eukprot:gb/GFBE01022264.1/.p1 GENE.gb/GFBE01022264.1/~~gb/GFBE01022264.1/.p1  ORF type:complete len:488 (+),score=97.67 gb/GFBE01022264.1/:1-1464(+)
MPSDTSFVTGALAGAAVGAVAGIAALSLLGKSRQKEFEAIKQDIVRLQASISSSSGSRPEQSQGQGGGLYAEDQRAKIAGITSNWTKPVVIASPALEPLAKQIRKRVGEEEHGYGETVSLDYFKSNDPNIKFNWTRVVGRKIVFLFDTVDQSRFFEQLSLLQALQGFSVPHGEDKNTKWKTYVEVGKYSWGRASKITVVIPWYRPCQMERTSRWHLGEDGKWINSNPEGQWLDVPCAQYMARLIATPGSVPPLPGPKESMDGMPLHPLWRPPLELLFVELHEEKPVERSVSDLGATIRMERFVPYFLEKFKGKSGYPGKNHMYILFPDHGAYDRYAVSVVDRLKLEADHILYIKKTRVGESIGQEQKLFYEDHEKNELERTASFTDKDSILIIDDFTNSGSTLFGAVELVKKCAGGSEKINVSIFVSHLVATYDPKVVAGLKDKLHKLGKQCRFFTTNSIPLTTDLLKDDEQATVIDISEFISDMVQ